MASMLRDVSETGVAHVNVDALRSEIRQALINQKVNACPIAMRLAWHAAGTFDKTNGTGGCDGGHIRFSPERDDPDNAGLHIISDLLLPVKKKHPEISHADLYVAAGCVAIEFLGGPSIPFKFGRSDDTDNRRCPANGRLPDASQGALHLRKVFGRMGFNDQEIVALSGAHTLGRCHKVRSGFDGPWTSKPLKFDNEYFVNLVERTWRPRQWDGPKQFEDAETGSLMMLPTDMALVQDPNFRVHVEAYAKDQSKWFEDFSAAYSKLLSLGCPARCNPRGVDPSPSSRAKASAEFREHAMHGSVIAAQKCAKDADVHELEATSGRSALHKAAFWGHVEMVSYLVRDAKLRVDVQDNYGDTALHDASKFGHTKVVEILLAGGANTSLHNKMHQTALDVSVEHGKTEIEAILRRVGSGSNASRL